MIHYITTQGLGQPWVGNELHVLQREGIPFVLHAMRPPEQRLFESEWATKLDSDTRTIYPLPLVGMVLSIVVAPVLFRRRFLTALLNGFFGHRESMRAWVATLAHFFVACHWARTTRHEQITHIHAHWAHSAASIGMYAAWLLGKGFSFTGHAVDLFRNRVALRDKIRRAEFIICISKFHRDFYLEQGARPEQLHLAYCGIDPALFAPRAEPRETDNVYRIISAGRLVEKKGFEYLIDACRLLTDRGERVECIIAGSGEMAEALRDRIRDRDLEETVTVTGDSLTQEQIPAFMHAGDLFCLPCVWARDNDVDGLPQMLMEAMACGLPVISTQLVGIPDLVIDNRTGALVMPRDSEKLAAAIQSMIHDPHHAAHLASAGRAWVVDRFNLANSLDPLIALFAAKLGQTHRRSQPAPSATTDTDEKSVVSGLEAEVRP